MIANLFKHEFRRTLPGFGLIAAVGAAVVGGSVLLTVLLPAPLNAIFSILGIGGAIIVPTAVVIWLPTPSWSPRNTRNAAMSTLNRKDTTNTRSSKIPSR